MPQEQYRTPAKFWPVIAQAIEAALARIRRHQEHPDVASHPPIEPQEWRDGEMLVTLAHGPDVLNHDEIARQRDAATNLLALVVHRYHNGRLEIPKAEFEALERGLMLSSARHVTEPLHVLTTKEAPRKLVVTG